MSKIDYLQLYAKGWTEGDVEAILAATSDSYVFDDPNAGKVSKAEFRAYFEGLKKAVGLPMPFMELSEVVTSDKDGVLTAWCWWAIWGTKVEGSGLIKVADDGVLSERIAYYTSLGREK